MAAQDSPQPGPAASAATTPAGPAGISDADIDALIAEMDKPAGAPAPASPTPVLQTAAAEDQDAIDALLASGSFEDPSPTVPPSSERVSAVENASAAVAKHVDLPSLAAAGALPLDLPDLQRAMADATASSIDLLRDVDLNVKIELGRSKMLVEDVLKLAEGSVVELDKLAGDPVDVFVNDRLVARGEVLVLNDAFCVRVNEIVAGTVEVA